MPPVEASDAKAFVLIVNGEATRSTAATLADLVASLGHDPASIATAVNGEFVPRRARAERRLAPSDRIEIVAPRQGG